MDREYRTNLIHSVVGFKSANLIGTVSKSGLTNLAMFGSVFHLGSNPPYIGFMVRPAESAIRNTYDNILETRDYTINHVSSEFIKQAHHTAARWPSECSEFEKCSLTEEFSDIITAPYVKESIVKIGLSLAKKIDIDLNGSHIFIGSVREIIAPEECIDTLGHIDLAKAGTVALSGIDTYHRASRIVRYQYPKPDQEPEEIK